MNILVTGGAGYIGSTVAAQLIESGHTVTVFDNLCAGHREALPAGAELIEGDLRDRESVLSLFGSRPFEAVMHFAAFASVGDSMLSPESYFRNNLIGSLNLLEGMVVGRGKKIVFSSTCAVYGVPDTVPITEANPTRPANPYGLSKRAVEEALEWYAEIHGFHFASLRYFNAAGATPERGEDHDPETHLVPIVLQVALGQRPHVELFGNDYPTPDGSCVRDYIHIVDLASAHTLALEALTEKSRIICNLGTETGSSVLEVVECARQVTGHRIPVKISPRRPGDPPTLVANSSLARRELGWKPQHTSLDSIIRSAWEWHSSHPHGYASKTCVDRA